MILMAAGSAVAPALDSKGLELKGAPPTTTPPPGSPIRSRAEGSFRLGVSSLLKGEAGRWECGGTGPGPSWQSWSPESKA